MGDIKHGVAWTKDLEMGNARVDAQHRRLFELVSDLIEACMHGCESLKLQETIDFLVNYTVRHFDDEEALQIQYEYPGYEEHKKMHEDFKVTVGNLVQRYMETGSTEELSSNVYRVIVRWLINHIQREDKKIGKHILSMRS